MKSIYDLLEEPRNEIYRRLILISLKSCDKFQYVMQYHVSKNESVQEIIKKIEKFQISVIEKSEWPGTKFFRGTAKIYQYSLNKESIILFLATSKFARGFMFVKRKWRTLACNKIS